MRTGQIQVADCPNCGAPCNAQWHGLDAVERTGDETLAYRSFKFSADQITEKVDRLGALNAELVAALDGVLMHHKDTCDGYCGNQHCAYVKARAALQKAEAE